MIRGALAVAVSLCIAAAATGQCQGPLFDAWQPFPEYTLSRLNAIATGDLDGDGDTDAVINRDANRGTVVLINDGMGLFTETQNITTFDADKIVLVDIEGDTDLDAILYGTVTLPFRFLVNDGTGVLTLDATELSIDEDSTHGDIDGDGDVDFVNPGGTLQIYEQTNPLIFTFRNGTVSHPSVVGAELWDIDGDSDLDLTFLDENNGDYLVSLNDGVGGFGEATSYSTFSGYNSQSHADIDNDDDLDVVVYNGNSQSEHSVRGFRNEGNGLFTDQGLLPKVRGVPGAYFHDYDNDGNLDLFQGHDRWYAGDGDWAFDFTHTTPDWAWEWLYIVPNWIEIVDLNGDGREEFLASAPSGSLHTGFAIDGNHLIEPADDSRFLPTDGSYTGTIGDIDADGDADIVAVQSGKIATVTNTGTGHLGDIVETSMSIFPQLNLMLTDMNQDGASDLVTVSDEVSVFLSDGQGGFGAPLISDPASDPAWAIDGAEIALINDDPFPDVFSVNDRPTDVVVWIGNGDGSFQTPVASPLTVPVDRVVGCSLGDFNGDGMTDAAVIEVTGRLVILQGNGDGTFSFASEIMYMSSCGSTFVRYELDVADIDDDGDLDLFAPIECTNYYATIVVFSNEGGWVFSDTEVLSGTSSSGWSTSIPSLHVDADDITGDGRMDLILSRSGPTLFVQSEAEGVFSVIPGEAGGGFGTPIVYRMGGGRFDLAGFADFDGDGDKDAVQVGYLRSAPGTSGFDAGVAIAFNRCTSPGCAADLTTVNAPFGDPNHGVPDGLVTAADLQYYVNAWVAQDASIADLTTQNAPIGDPNYGTPDGVVSAVDIQFYVNLWTQGCP